MAYSTSMDDTFRLRVEKIFGSLTSSSWQQPSSLQSTLWSLTDDEVVKREWRRGHSTAAFSAFDRDEIPCSSSFDDLKKDRRRNSRRELEDDVDELDDDDDREVRKRGDGDEWDIRSSIGLDRTLDNEEEEDEYDKVASGREDAGDRLYMKDATNPDSYLSIHSVIPESIHGSKDPRANRMAAKIRLQEDDEAAKNLNSPLGTYTEVKEQDIWPLHGNGNPLRSILKRKDNNSDSKSRKRVRFDPACETVSKEEESNEEMQADRIGSGIAYNSVPDYLRIPSKYTRFSFDSPTEVQQVSNASMITGSESDFEYASSNLPKSVTFIPKKKAGEPEAVENNSKVKEEREDANHQSSQHIGLPVGIAAWKSQESEANVSEDDEQEKMPQAKVLQPKKMGRNYRIKSGSDESAP